MPEKDRLFWLFFRFSGRVSRAVYILGFLFMTVVMTFPLYQSLRLPVDSDAAKAWYLVFMAAVLAALWVHIAFSVKRLHDIDRPGIIAAVLFIPVDLHLRLRRALRHRRQPRAEPVWRRYQRAGRGNLIWPLPQRHDVAHYRTLDPKLIIETAEKLDLRVAERFPDAGLRKVSAELVSLSRDLAVAAKALAEPIWWLRAVVGAIFLAGAAMFLFVGTILPLDRFSSGDDVLELVQGIEASLNTMILAVLGVLALVRVEDWIKRKQRVHAAARAALADPRHRHASAHQGSGRAVAEFQADPAFAGAQPNSQDLARYLDYCSEMLSITGKLAALFAQSVNDEVVINAVNDIEALGSNLSRKIWQKITLIENASAPRRG